jgi:hypothetical protein
MNSQQHSSNIWRNEMINGQDNNSKEDTVTSASSQDKRRRRINRWYLSGCNQTSARLHLHSIIVSDHARRLAYIYGCFEYNKGERKITHNCSLEYRFENNSTSSTSAMKGDPDYTGMIYTNSTTSICSSIITMQRLIHIHVLPIAQWSTINNNMNTAMLTVIENNWWTSKVSCIR